MLATEVGAHCFNLMDFIQMQELKVKNWRNKLKNVRFNFYSFLIKKFCV